MKKIMGFSTKFTGWWVLGIIVICCLLFIGIEIYWGSILKSGDIPLIKGRIAGSLTGILSRRAAGDIVDVTLKNTGYTKWVKHKDYLKVEIKQFDILPDGGEELAVAVSLPPQEGLVAVYSRQGSRMVYRCKVSGLLPVTGLSGVEVGFSGQQMLVVDQHQDEMLGAFFKADYKEFFLWNGRYFSRVLGLTTGYDAYWNLAWDGGDKGTHWLWLRQIPRVEYGEKGSPVIVELDQALLQSRSQDVGSIPPGEDFIKRLGRTVVQEYIWSRDWGRYIIGEGIDSKTGREVAILEDYSKSISGLLGSKHREMVKIIDREGKIEIIPSDRLNPKL